MSVLARSCSVIQSNLTRSYRYHDPKGPLSYAVTVMPLLGMLGVFSTGAMLSLSGMGETAKNHVKAVAQRQHGGGRSNKEEKEEGGRRTRRHPDTFVQQGSI